jgi:hypothetical protein
VAAKGAWRVDRTKKPRGQPRDESVTYRSASQPLPELVFADPHDRVVDASVGPVVVDAQDAAARDGEGGGPRQQGKPCDGAREAGQRRLVLATREQEEAVDEVALFLVVQKQKRPVGHLRQRAHRLLTCSFPSLVDLPPAGSSLILSARTTDSRDSDELTVYWNSRDTWNTIEHQH